jgi:2-(1,2-epoxy-1,2-dihydrophenyl)acetyl-CoA isomerase
MASNRVTAISNHLTANPTHGSEPVVKYEVLPGRVALITLNRPTRGNAFTLEMQEAYMNALDKANADTNVGAIVVTGAGKMFCVGKFKASYLSMCTSI